jgi:hypothetical protein
MKELSCDVLVTGGGTAGTAAAVAAARHGMQTILVEKETYLGGTAYAGRFQYICGLYLNSDAIPEETLNGGITREITHLLRHSLPESKIKKIGQVYVLPYQPDDLSFALAALCEAESHLTTFFDTVATSAEVRDQKITSLNVDGPDGKMIISASVVIDCSGDGVIADMSGAKFVLSSSDERQLAGYMVLLKGIKDADEMLPIKVPWHLAKAAESGLITPSLRFTTFSPGDRPDEGILKISIDGDDCRDRDERARGNAKEIIEYLSASLPAFIDAVIAQTSLRVVEREGRRICGEYTLTEEDILSARKFHDGVVKNAWPIELWDRSKGTVYKYVPRGDYYEIPFRCLIANGLQNLLAAGRCISATRTALGSTRVTGACMALGEKAGMAAAFCAKNGKYPEGRF